MDLISILYLVAGAVFSLAFIPQIRQLWRDTTGAASISISAWLMFSVCSTITLLYAINANGDIYFILSAFFGVVGNMTVLSLACWRRFNKKAAPEGGLVVSRINAAN